MQTVAVVIYRIQGLQRGANVIEVNFLCVQRSSTGLNVVFQHLSTGIGSVFFAQRLGPYAARYATNHCIFGVDTIAKEETQIGAKGIDVHAATQIVLDIRKPIGQGKRQLGDGVGTCFRNVVTTDGHRVEVAHLLINEILLHISHQSQSKFCRENTSVLRLIFL